MTVLSQYLYGHPVWLSLSSGGHAGTEVRAQALRVQPRHGQRRQPPATSSQPASHLPHHAARHYEQRGCDAASQSGSSLFFFSHFASHVLVIGTAEFNVLDFSWCKRKILTCLPHDAKEDVGTEEKVCCHCVTLLCVGWFRFLHRPVHPFCQNNNDLKLSTFLVSG